MIGNVSRHVISAYTQIAGMRGYGLAWVQSLIRIGTLFPILKKIDLLRTMVLGLEHPTLGIHAALFSLKVKAACDQLQSEL